MLLNIILIVILTIAAGHSQYVCPKSCNCTENFAICNSINFTPFGGTILKLKISNPKIPLIIKGQPFNITGLENLNSISIEYATILDIDETAFEGIPALSSFTIINSNIPRINNPLAFAKAQKLRTLRIANSTLRKFESIKSASLEELDLSGNYLTTVSRESFANHPNLNFINFENNNITTVSPDAFSSLPFLQEVTLSNNNITNLDPNLFKNNTELVSLNLSKNPLKKIDLNIESDLEKLMLSSCQLKGFSEEFAKNLILLSYLDLSNNRLNLSTNVFKNMEELEVIDLSNNHFKNLHPLMFQNNYKLQKIILDHNSFDELPQFKSQVGFETYFFSCKKCRISKFSEDVFQYMSRLVTLHLSHNFITGNQLVALQLLPNLVEINLSHNNISLIHPSSFTMSSSLKKINLAENPLKSVDANLFYNNRALKTLDVSFCGLRQLWKQPIKRSVYSLRQINIANNSLTAISVRDLQVTPYIKILDISNNPLHCDDVLRKTISWLTKHEVDPLFTSLRFKTHESAVIESEELQRDPTSWRFLVKDRCLDEHYFDNVKDKEEVSPAEPVMPENSAAINSTSSKDKNAIDADYYDEYYSMVDDEISKSINTKKSNLTSSNSENTKDDYDDDENYLHGDDDYTIALETSSSYSPWAIWTLVYTALSVLILALIIMLVLAGARGMIRNINFPHFSSKGRLNNHSGSVYQPLSEERIGPMETDFVRINNV